MDKTTLKHAVRRLKEHFDIGRIIFVADRGLFRRKTWISSKRRTTSSSSR